jgi:hypothetical protein
VYCARCGREMSLIRGVPTCATGDMPLSPHLAAVLADRFPVQAPRPQSVPVGRRLGDWFCPGCGVALGAELCCPSCGRSLRDLLHELVELHPHRDESGHW